MTPDEIASFQRELSSVGKKLNKDQEIKSYRIYAQLKCLKRVCEGTDRKDRKRYYTVCNKFMKLRKGTERIRKILKEKRCEREKSDPKKTRTSPGSTDGVELTDAERAMRVLNTVSATVPWANGTPSGENPVNATLPGFAMDHGQQPVSKRVFEQSLLKYDEGLPRRMRQSQWRKKLVSKMPRSRPEEQRQSFSALYSDPNNVMQSADQGWKNKMLRLQRGESSNAISKQNSTGRRKSHSQSSSRGKDTKVKSRRGRVSPTSARSTGNRASKTSPGPHRARTIKNRKDSIPKGPKKSCKAIDSYARPVNRERAESITADDLHPLFKDRTRPVNKLVNRLTRTGSITADDLHPYWKDCKYPGRSVSRIGDSSGMASA